MAPEECLKRGDLAGALAQLQDRVRASPASAADRVFLFQLLAVLGQWDRAQKQLAVAGELDASLIITVNAYTTAIAAEQVRASVFRGERAPMILGEPPPWIGPLVEATRLSASGHHVAAAELQSGAFDDSPSISGTLNGVPFEWIADADMRLGPCLEVIQNGGYYWVPFERIRELRSEPPANLRDLVWLPTQIEWSTGGKSPVFIPTRYPGTEGSTDDAARLARITNWLEVAPDMTTGIGQRLIVTNCGEFGLCEIRELLLGSRSATDDAGATESRDG